MRAGDAVPSELGYRVNMKHESRRGVPAHPGQSKAADSLRILPQAASQVPPSVVSLSHSEEINICLRASCLWMMSCFCLSPFFCENVEWGRGVKLNSLFWRPEEAADKSRVR